HLVVLSRGVSADAKKTPDHISQPAMPDLSMTAVSEGAVLPAAPSVASEAAAALQVADEDTDSELLGIFLEEAREVVGSGRNALQTLAQEPSNLSEQTVLRRAFHTLKGSSRMVGLDDFGQAGWAMEQMLNAWLAEQKAMPQPMQQLALQALNGFDTWVNAIEVDGAPQWQSAPFRASADAMRLDCRFIALDMAAVQGEVASDVAQPIAAIEAQQHSAADALSLTETLPAQSTAEQVFLEETATAALDEETPLATVPEAADFALPLDHFGDVDAAAPAESGPVATEAQEISFDEFDALLQAAGDGVSAPILSPFEDAFTAPLTLEADGVENPALADVQAAVVLASIEPAEPVDSVEAMVDQLSLDAESTPGDVPEPVATTKQIGDLSIALPLFNVYLGEAESWSYRLLDALTAWQENLDEAQPDMVIAWAHSLAGSSATVGFSELSGLARQLEHALDHVQPQAHGVAAQVQCFVQAAEEIRGLLHQFAAGFLRSASPEVLAKLQQILDAEVQLTPLVSSRVATQAVEAPALHEDGTEAFAPRGEVPSDGVEPTLTMGLTAPQGDDIDAIDVIDSDLFPIFEEEAVELLPTMGAAMRDWAAHPTRVEARSTLLRALHTLKGSARLAGAMRMGEMAHRLESVLEALDVDTATTEQIEPLFTRLDAIDANFNVLRAMDAQAQAAPWHAQPEAQAQQLPPVAAVDAVLPLVAAQLSPLGATSPSLAPSPLSVAQTWVNPTLAGVRQGSQPTVRVRSNLLDRLINEAGEVMIARSRLDERVGSIKASLGDLTHNLDRLRQQLRDIEVQAESQMQSRMQLSKEAGADFDPLEFDRFTRVQELTRMMAESVNDVATVQRTLLRDVTGAEDDLIAQGRQARELQRDLLRTRMVEFDSISERLYAVVRLTSKETGKQVKLGLSGGTIEMDRGVLERMVPAFEHLLRNCVDHGIELPEQRKAAGKSETGTISVQVEQSGNDVAVTFQDDGAGLNVARIRDKALALGLIAADEAIDAARAAQLVLMPGFTTAEQLTGVSGRGIGMDVVRTEVQALGGRIETSSEEGRGSSFRLVLPLTTAVTQVVMLRAGEFSVGVPASLVEMVRRVSLSDLEAAYRSGELLDGDARIPFFWAGAVWSQTPRSLDIGAGKTRPVIIFRSASQRIALHVDEVLGNQEVVVKNLGPQMSRLPGLTGMSVLASGAVVLIYNPVALTAVYGEHIQQLGQGLPALLDEHTAKQLQREAVPTDPVTGLASSSQVPLVMVVDDSITVRRVSQRLLQREGYRVVTAADGLQALEKLQDEVPCVVLSDIEMPRMDGFDLLRNIRAQERLQQLPIIMITSRIAQKHRDHAMQLGANHYLGKPYSDEELMGLVHHYAVGQALPVARTEATIEVSSTS
ncbi:MAG: Hpt domain-containing protein, partial [Comamonas sp.]|nr:Hpt domain-containing protein [Comamonas sp.]